MRLLLNVRPYMLGLVLSVAASGSVLGQVAASVKAPKAAQEGELVRVSGTSPTGPSGTTLSAQDDFGKIILMKVTWTGESFTAVFRAPGFNPLHPDNEVVVNVDPGGHHAEASSATLVTP